MGSTALTGSDTIILSDRVLSDFGNGDVVNLEFGNNLVEGKTGKNGNVVYSFNAMGKTVVCTLKVLMGSSDDKFLNSQIASYQSDPASYILMDGEFIKRVGDGKGNISNIIYLLGGGIIQKVPGAKDNVEGDTEQGNATYTILFANTSRIIQ